MLLVVVAWASVLALLLALRAHALAITLHAPRGAVSAGSVLCVSMIVEARRWQAPRAVTATLNLPPSLASKPVSFDFEARVRAEFELPVLVHAAGRHVVRGVTLVFSDPLGFWSIASDCARPVIVRALPRASHVSGRLVARFTNPTEGEAATARRGESPAFSDIDQYRPGDPLRRIAWAASLRHRRLLVKRTEEPEVTPVAIVLDASAGMRRGPEGARAIDVATGRSVALVRALGRARVPVALVVYHRRVIEQFRAAGRESARDELVKALTRLPTRVDESLYRVDEEALLQVVADALVQVGVRVRARASAMDLAVEAAAWMSRMAPRLGKSATTTRVPIDVDATLFEFASALGLVFPTADLESDVLRSAMNRAVRVATEFLEGPGRIVLISNFAGFVPAHASARNFPFLARSRSKPRVDIWPVTAAAPNHVTEMEADRTRSLAARVVRLVERADQVAFLRALSRVYPRTVTAPESERAWRARAVG